MKPGEFKATCNIKRPVQLADVPAELVPLVDADIRTPGRIKSRWDRDQRANVVDLPCAFETTDKAEFEAHMLEVHDRKMGSYQGVRGNWTGRYPRQLKQGRGMWNGPRLKPEGQPFVDKGERTTVCPTCGTVVEVTAASALPEHGCPAGELPQVGDTVTCIQIGHYGEHPARLDCMLIDAAGRCASPRVAS